MKPSILILLLFQFFNSYGQKPSSLETAMQHIRDNAKQWNLETKDFEKLNISSEAVSEKGYTYLYLNQTYDGIEIRNAMMVMLLDNNGKVAHTASTLIDRISDKVENTRATISAEQAIQSSANNLGKSLRSTPVGKGRNDKGSQIFEASDFTKSDIPAILKYELVGEKLILVWNLQLDMKDNADYWDMNIDAKSGNFVSKNNYTVYCKHHNDAFAHHNDCNFKTFKKLTENTVSVNEVLQGTATYKVFKLPAESPNHTTDRTLVSDDEYLVSSPYGWHDTNGQAGPEFQTLQGNNAHAYEDKDDDDDPDGADVSGGASLNFDFAWNYNTDSRQQSSPVLTNLFYMVNMIHDITALLGFDEQFGNFQEKNYSNKGDGRDYVLAQAFDGITKHEARQDLDAEGNPTKINNANFSTPVDGFNGRMQMYFWNNEGGSIFIDAPKSLEGAIPEYGIASFGKVIPLKTEAPISGKLIIARDGSKNNPTLCCGVISTDVKGKIAMIDRGICEFGKKVLNAQKAGAIAAIVCNVVGVNGGNGESADGMAGGVDGASVTIPSILLKKSDCDKIRLQLNNNVDVVLTFQERDRKGGKYLDGALDNGIIAHEFGHGISTRLTGGRANSSCLTNDEQMGEGWSDFFALILTQQPGDTGAKPRGIGTFAAAQNPNGSGIRRYPYSTDMNVNPQTYNNIKNTTAPHPLGEVWVSALWDMYWKFIDVYGYDSDWKVKTSGNFKAASLVIEGMKLQPCSPGFKEGRDAILKADSIFNGFQNKKIIWEAFARRGIGYNMNGGRTDNRNDGNEGFEILPTLLEKLKIVKSVKSSINPGEEIAVELNTINHIPAMQTNVIVVDELPNGMDYVVGSGNITPKIDGRNLNFELGDVAYLKANKITYKIKSSNSIKSNTLLLDNFEKDLVWELNDPEAGDEYWNTSNDYYKSGETSLGVFNIAEVADVSTDSYEFTVLGNKPAFKFWHKYRTEIGNDGGFIEISVDGGPFEMIKKNQFISNGYDNDIAYSTIAIPGLQGFSGTFSKDWKDTYIDASPYIGKKVKLRFRFVSNATIAPTQTDLFGWNIDDFELVDLFKYTVKACIGSNGGIDNQACTIAQDILVNSDGILNNSDDTKKDYFGVNLLPNPARDYLYLGITSPKNTEAVVSITDMDGKSIFNQNIKVDNNETSLSINTSSYPKGVYVVKINSGSNQSTRKLVIH